MAERSGSFLIGQSASLDLHDSFSFFFVTNSVAVLDHLAKGDQCTAEASPLT